MKNQSSFVWLYAITLLIGGVIGFIKAGSLVSLLSASFFSSILIISGYRMRLNQTIKPYLATTTVVAILFGFFAFRFFNSFQIVPGIISHFSLVMLIYLLASAKNIRNLKEKLKRLFTMLDYVYPIDHNDRILKIQEDLRVIDKCLGNILVSMSF